MIKQDLPWFRFYKEAIDDAKLKLIAYEDRWHFVALLCCKAQGLLEVDTPLARPKICIKLGLDSRELEEVIRRLAEVELVDARTMEPLAWDKRQFKSDGDPTSAERKRRSRERHASCHASVTVADTEADTEAEQKNTYSTEFENVWQVYPNRPGRSKAAAYKAWKARIKAGDTPEAMATGAASYATYCKALATDPQYIRQPETFFGPSRHFASDWTVQRGQAKGPATSLNLLPPTSPRIPNVEDLKVIPDWLLDDDGSVPDWLRPGVKEVQHAG